MNYVRRGGDAKKVVIAGNAVDTTRFARVEGCHLRNLREILRLKQEDIVVGRIGQPIVGKWSPLILDTFGELCNLNADVKLLLVGAPEDIQKLAMDSPFSKKIIIVNQINNDAELARYYSLIDIFCHISTQGESFGMVLTEAMLCKTPIITFATPWADNSQGEIIGHEEGGLVAYDRKQFTKKLYDLVVNKKKRELLGENGRKRVIQQYQARILAKRCLLFIKNKPKINFDISQKEILLSNAEYTFLSKVIIYFNLDYNFLRLTTGFWNVGDLFKNIHHKIMKQHR